MDNKTKLEAIASEVRRGVFDIIKNAKSGHLGGCSSSVELMTALYFGGVLNYNAGNPRDASRDRVLVRGHLGPLRYKIFSLIGWIPEEELLTYRQLDSRLQGHEDMKLVPGVDITPSGLLGMLLSYGVGSGLVSKKTGINYKTFVFLGDGEEQEGNVSEAARHASNISLDNLICILDKNGKQLSRSTQRSDSNTDIKKMWEGYGWDVLEIKNGHDFDEIMHTYGKLAEIKRPTFIVANTIKGKGLSGCIDSICGYHTISRCTPECLDEGIKAEEENLKKLNVKIQEAVTELIPRNESIEVLNFPSSVAFNIDLIRSKNLVDSFFEYSNQIVKEAKRNNIRLYAMTADLIKDDQVSELGFDDPVIYVDVGIREQHMIAMAHGISVSDPQSKIFINPNDAFLYRALDQLNAAAQGKSDMVLVGDDGGLSGGKNGSTHQSTGQPGALISMPGVTLLEPADSVDLGLCLEKAFSEIKGPVYIRIHSADFNFIDLEKRNVEYYITHDSEFPDITIVSSGLPTVPATNSAMLLKREGIEARVINVINMNSLDYEFSKMVVHRKPLFTFYNGNPEILSSTVSNALLKNVGNVPSQIISHGFLIGASGPID
ncbi:MAG: transketolase C-terminal domain-containing protein, partial [Nanoarchaeota archaeon]|nr:transketolase C-terminal domain-containing protein [Nanoarchaeota archaeon]